MANNNFSFNEDQNLSAGNRKRPGKGGFANKLISLGLAKTPAQANMYLIGLVVICLGLIVYMNVQTFSSPALIETTDVRP